MPKLTNANGHGAPAWLMVVVLLSVFSALLIALIRMSRDPRN
jgi:hypothetical protein